MNARSAPAALLFLALAVGAHAQPPAEAPPTVAAGTLCLTNACDDPAANPALAAAIAANDHLGVIRAGGTARQALEAALASGAFRPPNGNLDLASVRYAIANNGAPSLAYYSATGLRQGWQPLGMADAIRSAFDVSQLPAMADVFPNVTPGTYQPAQPYFSPGGPPPRPAGPGFVNAPAAQPR